MSRWKFTVFTRAAVIGITYIHTVATFMWFNITVLNIMMLIVTGKLQDFTIFNKTNLFEYYWGEDTKIFLQHPQLLFSSRNSRSCVIFEGQRLRSTEFECQKVC